MSTIPAIDQAERLIHKLAGRGITLSLVDGGTALWAAPATSLRPQDRQALRQLKPVLIAILSSPSHSCMRCDILRVGAAVLGVPVQPLISWNYPNVWLPWTRPGITPARNYGDRSLPMTERDLSARDPALLPQMRGVVIGGCQALGLNANEVFSTVFKDMPTKDVSAVESCQEDTSVRPNGMQPARLARRSEADQHTSEEKEASIEEPHQRNT